MWELALLLVAATYMVVNMVALFVQLKMMNKYGNLFNKSIKFCEKMIDQSDKMMGEMFDDN